MSKRLRSLSRFSKNIILSFLMMSLIFSSVSFADSQAKAEPRSHPKEAKTITLKKAQKITQKAIAEFSKHKVFLETELPLKTVLGLVIVKADVPFKTQTFTNLVLAELLDHAPLMIVNQDFTFDKDQAFTLTHYDDIKTLKRRGLMFGANYYLIGELRDYSFVHKEKKMKVHYLLELQFVNISSDEVLVAQTFKFSQKGKLLKEKPQKIVQSKER